MSVAAESMNSIIETRQNTAIHEKCQDISCVIDIETQIYAEVEVQVQVTVHLEIKLNNNVDYSGLNQNKRQR